MAAPALPPSFPCWVKAIYSYGGETKRDLGFLEGDYIECLNAGDGSWWTGRLKRDPRSIGKFPCNFVKVLDNGSLPPSLNGSPMPSRATREASRADSTPPSSGNTTPVKHKSMFRKPFSAHAAASSPAPQSSPSPTKKPEPRPRKNFAPYSSMKKFEHMTPPPSATPPHPPSPKIPKPIARGGLPRAAPISPQKSQAVAVTAVRRPVSPAPMPSIEHDDNVGSSPPPPPPPAHRVAFSSPAPANDMPTPSRGYGNEPVAYSTPARAVRSPSAELYSHSGFTPSPLRDAMDDVMSSLEEMRVEEDGAGGYGQYAEPEEEPQEIWSPDDYDRLHETSYDDQDQGDPVNHNHDLGQMDDFDDEQHQVNHSMPPQEDRNAMHDYVRRMQARLESLEEEGMQADAGGQDIYDSGRGLASGDRGEYPYGVSRPSSQASQRSRPGSPSGLVSHGGNRLGHRRADSSDPFSGPDSYYSSLKRKLSRRMPKESRSAQELGRSWTQRSTVTTVSSNAHSTSTDNSNSTHLTNPSLMSGYSAGGFSATSAGSLARRGIPTPSHTLDPVPDVDRPGSPGTGYSWHESHASNERAELSFATDTREAFGGGYSSPASRKRNLFQRLRDTAKTSAASARGSIAGGGPYEGPPRPRSALANGLSSIAGGVASKDVPRNAGLKGTPDRSTGVDWVQSRRDVNRANSLSRNERDERAERCQMLDIPVLNPVDIMGEYTEGDESADGYPVSDPTDFQVGNLSLVDKNARLVSQLPGVVNAASLARTYLCRQYRSDVQRLRAIFTWVSERLAWEEPYEGRRDSRNVIVSRRGSTEEIAHLVADLCAAVGFQAEVVRGYLKTPGETFSAHELSEAAARPNHWWNAVICDGEWRMMDCALANPSNPHRSLYSSAGNQAAEGWYFLARPMQMCYTHVALLPEQQHITPGVAHEILMALPGTCPTFFKNNCQMWDYDTSLVHLAGLEMAHVQIAVPDDVEINAEVEARSFARDTDGDLFESGEVERKRALAQAEFVTVPDAPDAPFKRYTIKAVLPSGATVGPQACLKVYAGKRGLQHGIQSNPHNMALCLPLTHDGGQNPPFEFVLRHPTPHALRHELYLIGPLCRTLAVNNTVVFAVRQHPSSPNAGSGTAAAGGPAPSRPGSAMSMTSASASASGSQYSNPSNTSSSSGSSSGGPRKAGEEKPAKLAVQSPSGKIMRMGRKAGSGPGEAGAGGGAEGEARRVGAVYETIIKIGEKGTWRGLVLADRAARWCVFGEWEAV